MRYGLPGGFVTLGEFIVTAIRFSCDVGPSTAATWQIWRRHSRSHLAGGADERGNGRGGPDTGQPQSPDCHWVSGWLRRYHTKSKNVYDTGNCCNCNYGGLALFVALGNRR